MKKVKEFLEFTWMMLLLYVLPAMLGTLSGIGFMHALVLTVMGKVTMTQVLHMLPATLFLVLRRVFFGTSSDIGGVIQFLFIGGMLSGMVGVLIFTTLYNLGIRFIIVPH